MLAACDDGDVVGYQMSAIQRAVEKAATDAASGNVDQSNPPRVFFHENVRKSAWGLAVHREARMIAISANTSQVTVIAFALADKARINSNEDV